MRRESSALRCHRGRYTCSPEFAAPHVECDAFRRSSLRTRRWNGYRLACWAPTKGNCGDSDASTRWIREFSDLHAARKQRAQQAPKSIQVLSGVQAKSQGARCVNTLVVAESPLSRIKGITPDGTLDH